MLQGIVFFAVGLVAIAIVASRHRGIAAPLLVGFLARGAFAVADYLFLGLSRTGDGAGWDGWARLWAKQGLAEIFSHVETGHNLYKVFMALCYFLFGHSPLMIQMINAALGTLVILFVWKLAWLLCEDGRAALRAAWLAALFPSIVLHSGMLLREVAVTLPLTIGVYNLALWHRTRRVPPALKAGAALLVSMAFHSGAFAVLVALSAWAVGSWLKALVTGRLRLAGLNTLAVALAVGAVAFASATGWGMDKFSNLDTADVSSLAQTQDYGAKGRTAYLGDMRAGSTGELALQSPIRVAYFLFAPFPWMLSGFRDVIGLADALFFLWLIWRAARGWRFLRANATATFVAAMFAALAVTFALGVSNYGTAFRHRNKMLPMLIAVSAVIPIREKKKARDLHRSLVRQQVATMQDANRDRV